MPATEVISDHLADCDVQVADTEIPWSSLPLNNSTRLLELLFGLWVSQPASRTRSSKEHIPTGLPQLWFSDGFAGSANFFQETSSSVGLHQLGSTPSLRCQTMIAEAVLKSSGSDDLDSPKLERKTNTPKSAKSVANSPKPLLGSNPSWIALPDNHPSIDLAADICDVALCAVYSWMTLQAISEKKRSRLAGNHQHHK
ncbi:hypothetical protein RHMOL_Rhmol11G0091800 [Rhododendron molle]|uniref:Uncharacterized protein n=1 Tax=Rhododendron molle TaxID=49168 RepID=A0ACC0LRS0_RHOML|nr:hypothetical protein RHMOL_Rhmol11G0091800 [Rhododendron molle]